MYEVEEACRSVVCDDRSESEVAYGCDGCDDHCGLVYGVWGICGVEEENEIGEGGGVRCELHLLPCIADDRVLEMPECGEIHRGVQAIQRTEKRCCSHLPYFLRGRGQTNDDTLPAPQRASPFPRGNPGGHARYHVTQRAATTALFSYFSEAVAEHRAILHTLPTPCFPSARSPVPRPLSVHARVRASSRPLPPRGYALQRPPLTRQTITSPFLLFPPPSAHSPFSTSPPHSQMTYLLRQTRHRHHSTLLLVS